MEFCGFVLDPDDIWVSGGSVEGSVISKFLPLKNIDKKLQKSLLSFFKIMPQFCSTNPGPENELDNTVVINCRNTEFGSGSFFVILHGVA